MCLSSKKILFKKFLFNFQILQQFSFLNRINYRTINLEERRYTKSEANELQRNEKEIIVEKDIELQTSSKKICKNRKKGKNLEWNFQAVHAEKEIEDKDEKKIK